MDEPAIGSSAAAPAPHGLPTDAVRETIWHSATGPIVIRQLADGSVWVNGKQVDMPSQLRALGSGDLG